MTSLFNRGGIGFAAFVLVGGLSFAEPPDVPASERIQRIVEDSVALDRVPFGEVIEAATGFRVIPVDRRRHRATIDALPKVIQAAINALSRPDHPIHQSPRINEASRFIEDELMEMLNAVDGWECTLPVTAAGSPQRSGYPDLRLETPQGIFYLDPKLVASGSEISAFRTFYYEPKDETGKVRDDAVHLLLGVIHGGLQDGTLRFEGWKLVDVSALSVRVKAEFQAGNRELYAPALVVAEAATDSADGKKK